MVLLQDAVKEKLFDLRLVEKNLCRTVMTQKDWDQYVKNLPDDEIRCLWVKVNAISGDSDS